MKTDIYITEFNETENRKLIIDSDEHSVWAYILDSENKIELDGFLFSCGTIVESIENIQEFIDKDFQPPLAKRFENKFSVLSGIKNENIKIIWGENLIKIFLNGIEYLVMDILNRQSYSKAISEKGAYGNPLTAK